MDSHDGKVELCQMPESLLQNLSTDELLEVVLDYPFYMDVYAYDNLKQGYESVKSKFNGLKNWKDVMIQQKL